ncbi:MAG: RluA family pseudouridine synthase [Lentisphaeria bacterium]|nr:RluA family pseudouridine synthase [Lentisphaeria bacterium]
MARRLDFTVPAEVAGTRLDRCLSRLIPDSSRAYLQKLIRSGAVLCDGMACTVPRQPVVPGMRVEVDMPEAEGGEAAPAAEPFAYDILYEDDWMLVVDKPAGVVVHPAAGNPSGTIVNALLGRYPEWGKSFPGVDARPGIVHRLDKDTSGCLVVAKTPDAQFKLGTAFAERKTAKTYLTIVRGEPPRPQGELSGMIGRHPVNRQKMALLERGGKEALTRYRVLSSGELAGRVVSLLEVKIMTGRTHQIRVHMASIGTPVLGDGLYGGARGVEFPVPRQMLHAWRLSLPHPADGRRLEFESPGPADFREVAAAAALTLPKQIAV